jgi:Flp pilus assembly protein TadG
MHQSRLGRRRSRTCQNRRGAALIEFAFVAPIFFVMVMGIFEFARAMMVQTLLTSASQQGARAGAMNGAQVADVTTTVNNYLSSAGVTGASTTCSPSPPSSAAPGQDVKVIVTIPYASVSWLPAPHYLKTATLSSTAIVQRETGQ